MDQFSIDICLILFMAAELIFNPVQCSISIIRPVIIIIIIIINSKI